MFWRQNRCAPRRNVGPGCENEDSSPRKAWSSPNNIVKSSLSENDSFRELFSLASAVMHGRLLRGYELLEEGKSITDRAQILGLLVLERLCSVDDEMDRLSISVAALSRMQHAAQNGGNTSAADDVIARHIFGEQNVALTARFGLRRRGDATESIPFQAAFRILSRNPQAFAAARRRD